jgi:hypothetical protein
MTKIYKITNGVIEQWIAAETLEEVQLFCSTYRDGEYTAIDEYTYIEI